jgi:hypothetical protein
VLHIADLVLNSQISRRQKSLLLPVFYSNLDVVGIPTIQQLDVLDEAASSAVRSTVIKALISFRCLAMPITIDSQDAFIQLLPRSWGWVVFFHTYREQLTWCKPPPFEWDICRDFLKFVSQFDARVSKALSITPEFQIMVVRTWALSVQTVKSAYDYATLSSIVIDHIQSWKGWNPSVSSNLQNLTDGAGGTIDDVAILVVGHIHRVLQIGVDDDEMEPHHILALLHGLLVFLAEIERPESMHETGNSMVTAGPLARALSARGFVPAVVFLMRALSSPPLVSVQPSSAVTISRCFMLLERILLASEGHRLLPDALEAGLLVALVSCATTDMADSVYRDFMAFLCGILPASLIYYNVVARMAVALNGAQELECSPKFKRSKIFNVWHEFKALALERLRVLESFTSMRSPSYKACDYLGVS